jgi:hypothetical protein
MEYTMFELFDLLFWASLVVGIVTILAVSSFTLLKLTAKIVNLVKRAFYFLKSRKGMITGPDGKTSYTTYERV